MTETLLSELVLFITSEQVWIALLGVTAIALSQSTDVKKRRWACIFGLAGQPFWFYMTYKQNSWGVFILCLFYTLAWLRGFVNYWVPSLQPKDKKDDVFPNLIEKFHQDHEYAMSWHHNIACCVMDASTEEEPISHATANAAASRFMHHAFGIITKLPDAEKIVQKT